MVDTCEFTSRVGAGTTDCVKAYRLDRYGNEVNSACAVKLGGTAIKPRPFSKDEAFLYVIFLFG